MNIIINKGMKTLMLLCILDVLDLRGDGAGTRISREFSCFAFFSSTFARSSSTTNFDSVSLQQDHHHSHQFFHSSINYSKLFHKLLSSSATRSPSFSSILPSHLSQLSARGSPWWLPETVGESAAISEGGLEGEPPLHLGIGNGEHCDNREASVCG